MQTISGPIIWKGCFCKNSPKIKSSLFYLENIHTKFEKNPMENHIKKEFKTRIGVFAQRQILCVSLHGLQAGHSDAPPTPQFGWPKITFDRISRHFRSIHNFVLNFFFSKWLPAAILKYRKSLSIIFLAISDQCTTFIYFFTRFKFICLLILWQ